LGARLLEQVRSAARCYRCRDREAAMDPNTILVVALLGAYAVGLGIALLATAADMTERRRRRRLAGSEALELGLSESSRRLGLHLKRYRGGKRLGLSGRMEGSHVAVEFLWREEGAWATTVTLVPHPHLPYDVWFHSRWAPGAVDGPSVALPDLDTGDAAFDKLIEVGGRAMTLRALLSNGARRALVACARRGSLRLRAGSFEQRFVEPTWSTDRLKVHLSETLAAAQVLRENRDVVAAVADNAQLDPEPGVRARCLTTLLSEHPAHARTAATLEAALSDESDIVRVVAAIALGERGVPVLVEIATKEDGDEQAAARAIATLGRRLPTERVLAILASAMPRERRAVALAAIGALARVGDPSALDRLDALLRDADEACAVAAARALGQTRSPSQEAPLLDALDSESLAVRRAAVRALAEVGGLAALARLLALAADGRSDRDLVRIAHETLAAVQGRLPDAAPGQVSLADSDIGHVSLVESDEHGRVSLCCDAEGESSPRRPRPTADSEGSNHAVAGRSGVARRRI
jgi:hypothetical protein